MEVKQTLISAISQIVEPRSVFYDLNKNLGEACTYGLYFPLMFSLNSKLDTMEHVDEAISLKDEIYDCTIDLGAAPGHMRPNILKGICGLKDALATRLNKIAAFEQLFDGVQIKTVVDNETIPKMRVVSHIPEFMFNSQMRVGNPGEAKGMNIHIQHIEFIWDEECERLWKDFHFLKRIIARGVERFKGAETESVVYTTFVPSTANYEVTPLLDDPIEHYPVKLVWNPTTFEFMDSLIKSLGMVTASGLFSILSELKTRYKLGNMGGKIHDHIFDLLKSTEEEETREEDEEEDEIEEAIINDETKEEEECSSEEECDWGDECILGEESDYKETGSISSFDDEQEEEDTEEEEEPEEWNTIKSDLDWKAWTKVKELAKEGWEKKEGDEYGDEDDARQLARRQKLYMFNTTVPRDYVAVRALKYAKDGRTYTVEEETRYFMLESGCTPAKKKREE